MDIRISYYQESDYEQVLALYNEGKTFGGQYDDARDTKEKLSTLINMKIWSILVAKIEDRVVGTVTLFEDSRAAWLYRFAVQKENELEISKKLSYEALKILKENNHSQVLVYAPKDDGLLEERYSQLGFNKGGDYTCYWRDI